MPNTTRSQSSGDFLAETQLIGTISIDASQNTRAHKVKILGSDESNRVVDSSCDFRDSVDTQQLLDAEPDTVLISEPPKSSNKSRTDDKKSQDSQALFKHLKLPDSESPWLRHIKDPFEDTPAGKKNLWGETPIHKKVRNPFEDTPLIHRKVITDAAPMTPSGGTAHKIFQKLREDQADQSELEVDTQPIPSLAFDTQAVEQTPTQKRSDPGVLSSEKSDPTPEDEGDEGDTIADAPETNQDRGNDSDILNSQEVSQAALQIPGTVPEEENKSDVENSHIYENTSFVNDAASSPVVSDDGNRGDNANDHKNEDDYDDNTKNDSSGVGRHYDFIAEDSIQITHNRDADKTLQSPDDSAVFRFPKPALVVDSPLSNAFNSNSNSSGRTNFRSQLLGEETPSRPSATSDLTTRDLDTSSPMLSRHGPPVNDISEDTVADVEQDLTKADGEEEVKIVRDDQGPESEGEAEAEAEAEAEVLVQNITQELSDIDDETKADRSRAEEDEGSRIIRPRRARRKRVSVLQSPPPLKRVKSSSQKLMSELKSLSGGSSPLSTPETPHDDFEHKNESEHEHEEEHEDTTFQDEEMKDVPSQDDPQPHMASKLPTGPLTEDKFVLTEKDVISKNSVWYLYETFYYPGVVVGAGDGIPVVRFADRTQEAMGLFPLDIRIGDTITKDDTEFRVVGLDCEFPDVSEVIRCMRGYDVVVCRKIKKIKRKKDALTGADIRFALADIKMAQADWLKTARVGSDLEVSRRRTQGTQGKPVVTFEDELLQSISRKPVVDPSKIFSGCLFALTGLDDRLKNSLESLITDNGGVIAENGFEPYVELLDGKHTLRQSKKSLIEFRFAALITGKPSRYPKYFEALALGWPVLSYEYVEHCVEQGVLLKNLHTYLLPSGVSKTLHGGVKSADIGKFVSNWQNDFDLSLQLSNNRVLANRAVLLVDADPSISEFLFHALGATTKHIKLTNNTKLINDSLCMAKESDLPVYIYGKRLGALHRSVKAFESGNPKKQSVLKGMMEKEVLLELIDWDWLVECIVSGYPWKSTVMTLRP